MGRAKSHLRRTGTTRGFALHYRHLGVSIPKLDRWILHHYSAIRNIIIRSSRGHRFNAQMGAAAIARQDYRPDRALDLRGVAAYDREKQKCMKDLGLTTKDNRITQRMLGYIHVLQGRGNTIPLLRDYGMRIKLQGPQIAWRDFSLGDRQMGYAHCRIRPLVMFLYALKSAIEHGVDVNTDDIALSAFRVFTPQEIPKVDEEILITYIDDYFSQKTSSGMPYEQRFKDQFAKVEKELGKRLAHRDAFKQKCRNAANEIYCTSLFLRRVGLIESQQKLPSNWSATQMSYGRTGPVVFAIFTLTNEGSNELSAALSRIPVWGKDIIDLFPDNWPQAINVVNRLAQNRPVTVGSATDPIVAGLSTLGIVVSRRGGRHIPSKSPEFELQYDLT